LLFFGLLAFGIQNAFLLVLAVIFTAFFMGVSGIWHAIVLRLETRWPLNPVLRTFAFILPFLMLPLFAFVPRPHNKKTPAVDEDRMYEAHVDVRDRRWRIRIQNKEAGETYEDHTDLVGHLNCYWQWDGDGNFWLYSTDAADVFCYRRVDGKWEKTRWGMRGRKMSAEIDIHPPESLYD
jgi:hypothetical protein